MEPKAEEPERPVAAHRAIGKRRIADREIKVLGEFGPCEVLVDDMDARMQQGCDARGDRIEFDAGDIAEAAQVLGHEGCKEARADTRLEHTSATKAEPRDA